MITTIYSFIKKNQLEKKLPFLILIYGLSIRIYTYLYSKSVWHDEISIATSLEKTSFLHLHLPFSGSPGGAFIFNLIEKMMFECAGYNDYALRFFPCLWACLSLILFYYTVTRYCSKWVAILSCLFFACTSNLVYYAAELRPYSLDVLIATVIIFLYFYYRNTTQLSLKNSVIIGGVGVVCVFASFITPFLLASLGLALLIPKLQKKEWACVRALVFIAVVWFFSFAFYYWVSLRFWTAQSDRMTYYHLAFQYLHFPVASIKELQENSVQWFRLLAYFSGLNLRAIYLTPSDIIASFYSLGAFLVLLKQYLWFLVFIIITILTNGLLLCWGILSGWKKDYIQSIFLFLPLLFAVIASVLYIYPFVGRHLLYLFPFIILCICFFLTHLYDSKPRLAVILSCLFLAYPILNSVYHIDQPRTLNRLKEGLQLFSKVQLERDLKSSKEPLFIVKTERDALALFYAKRYNIVLSDVTVLESIDELADIQLKTPSAWFILTHPQQTDAPRQFIQKCLNQSYVVYTAALSDNYTTVLYITKNKDFHSPDLLRQPFNKIRD